MHLCEIWKCQNWWMVMEFFIPNFGLQILGMFILDQLIWIGNLCQRWSSCHLSVLCLSKILFFRSYKLEDENLWDLNSVNNHWLKPSEKKWQLSFWDCQFIPNFYKFLQVKELGVVIWNCTCVANDLYKIFNIYWRLGVDEAKIPYKWPLNLRTYFNFSHPLKLLSATDASVFISVRFLIIPPLTGGKYILIYLLLITVNFDYMILIVTLFGLWFFDMKH